MGFDNEQETVLDLKYNGDNFPLWEFVLPFMVDAGLWPIGNGEEGFPENGKWFEKEAWRTKDRNAFKIILSRLEEDQIYPIMEAKAKTSHAAWTILKTNFEERMWPYMNRLLDHKYSLKMGEGQSLSRHLAEVCSINSKLRAVGFVFSEAELMADALKTLPESYAKIVSIAGHAEGLTMNTLCEYLLIDEIRQKKKAQETSEMPIKRRRGRGGANMVWVLPTEVLAPLKMSEIPSSTFATSATGLVT